MAGDLFDNWFNPPEAEVRARSREFIEELARYAKGDFARLPKGAMELGALKPRLIVAAGLRSAWLAEFYRTCRSSLPAVLPTPSRSASPKAIRDRAAWRPEMS
jgi:hypothetical protein